MSDQRPAYRFWLCDVTTLPAHCDVLVTHTFASDSEAADFRAAFASAADALTEPHPRQRYAGCWARPYLFTVSARAASITLSLLSFRITQFRMYAVTGYDVAQVIHDAEMLLRACNAL